MDATGLILTIIDAGMKIKASIDKINQNRSRLRDLADDTLEDLYAMVAFCDSHNPDLRNAPELEASLVKLNNKLLNVASKCERMLNFELKGKMAKMVHGFKQWRDADDIEAEVGRLRAIIQGCVNRIHLYVAARNELAIARVEHNVLVLKSDFRANIERFDGAFGTSIRGPNSAEFTPLLHHCAPDDHDIQYLRLKLHDIAESLQTAKFSFVDATSFRTGFPVYTPVYCGPEEIISIIESSLVPTWRVIQSLRSGTEIPLSGSFLDTAFQLSCDCAQYGITDVTYRIWAIIRQILRGFMGINDDERLLAYFSRILAIQSFFCPPGREQISLSQESVDIQWKLYRSHRRTYPKIHSLMWLQRAMHTLAWTYHDNGDTDAAITYLREALQMNSSFEDIDCRIRNTPITYSISGVHSSGFYPPRILVQDYLVAQTTAFLSSSYAFMLESCGYYSDAFNAGRDSLAIIDALRDQAHMLPSNFDFYDDYAVWIRTNLPTWVGVVRDPMVVEEVYEDAESESAVSYDHVEWGIAI